ncbi:MAG: sulfotransferase [Anaerolineales bacterium]|nr:sulfotransferase [Anaerolineales bacterium]
MKETQSPRLYNKALEFGLVPGHKGYTRFIILSRSRSGSNLLRGLLNSHSQVVTFSEMFKNPNIIGWDISGYPNSGRVLDLFQKDTRLFIRKEVFKKFPKQIKAVGFKIFYYHAYGTELAPVWDYLKEDHRIHVIHLKRNNILKTHVSKKRAQITDNWINLTGERETAPKFKLDYEELLNDFTQTRAWEAEAEQFFKGHPKIEINYEQLVRDFAGEMTKIQAFLGLDYEQVFPQTHKQASKPLSATIENYLELKKRFADTPWEVFFTE